jgi:transposase-like protein
MAINGSGIRDTVKVLGVGINTVIKQIKKTSKHLHAINLKYLYEK